MENGLSEDVFPIENGDIPASYVSLLEGILPNLCHNICILLLQPSFAPIQNTS